MTVVISTAALILSLAAFLTTRWRDRRDLLLGIHERLTTADQQHGRRLIYEMSERNLSVRDLSDDDYALINNALATLNNLGLYYKRRYIRRKDILVIWALAVVRLTRAAEPFLAHRDELIGTRSWPELRELAADAEKHLQRRKIDVKAVEARTTELPSLEI